MCTCIKYCLKHHAPIGHLYGCKFYNNTIHLYKHIQPTVIKVQDLSDSFEQVGRSNPHAKFGETTAEEVSDELVQDSTKAWNKVRKQMPIT